MKRTITLGLIGTMIISSQVALAQEPITGAFGLTLGQEFDESMALSDNLGSESKVAYAFEATKPYEKLSIYGVLVTPITKKIYGINGLGQKIPESACKDDMDVLVSLLSKKYGEFKSPNQISFDPILQLKRNRKYIRVMCSSELTTANLDVVYIDENLMDLAEKERIEIESQKVNRDGL